MFAVIHLPTFSLQAVLRHTPEARSQPVALVDPAVHPPRIESCTESAASAGVLQYQTVTQAQARSPDLVIRSRSILQEKAATDALIQCAYGFSPYLESTGDGTLTLDLTGLAELRQASPDQLREWAGRMQLALAGHQFQARIGIGPTPTLARHAALWGPPIQVVERAEAFLNQLPVMALEPSSHTASLLEKWGIRTVGELVALGQAEVTERLGLEAFSLFAAASPRQARPLRLISLPDRYEETYDFDPPVETIEPLLFLLRRWVDQFSLRLTGLGWVAGALTLQWRMESGASSERRLQLPHPTAQPGILFRLLHTFLETLQTESSLVGIGLKLEPARPVQHQFTLFEATLKDPHQLQETLARLTALLGADRVGTPVRENSHRPDAFHLVAPDFESTPPSPTSKSLDPFRPLPFRQLRPSPTAKVETSNTTDSTDSAPPLGLASPPVSGPIRFALGPWKRSGHWWEDNRWSREEWEVETRSGITCRLVRTAEGWQVTGILD